MNLAEFLSQPVPHIDYLRGCGLVFEAEYLQDLEQAQAGEEVFRAGPIALSDGRHALKADLLSEIGEGGIFARQFALLDATKFPHVQVLPWEEVQPLIPSEEEL